MLNKITEFLCLALIIILSAGIASCSPSRSQLDSIRESGVLRVVTTYNPTTYYIDTDSETGFEYELARMFAEYLDVRLKIVIARNKSEIITILKNGQADIAAGLLKRTVTDDKSLIFGPEYITVKQQVAYRSGIDRPRTPDDLYPFQLHVADGTIRIDKLVGLKQQYPDFNWKIHNDAGNIDLLELVNQEKIAYAIVYSNELTMARQTNPELRAAFDLLEPAPLAWVLRKVNSNTLLETLGEFFDTINQDDRLAELIEQFYGPVKEFDYVDQRKFVERISTRLPDYEELFRQAGEKYALDWRLLAAVSYQESHWNERARSPTGVRGLMMLTLTTAQQVDVANRLDPEQSVFGGAKYIRQLIESIPQRIPQPDRVWLALAAYNVGFGHLEDARVITEKRGDNPDKWQDVKVSLPLLRQREWYKQTLFGYARGNEAVTYVENVRKYYNTLVQLTRSDYNYEPDNKVPALNPSFL